MGKGLPYSMKRAAVRGFAASSVASAAGAGVTLTDLGGLEKTVRLSLVDAVIPLTDEAGVVAFGGLKVLDLPEGLIEFRGAIMDLALTKSSAGVNDDWDGDIALGSVTASNNATLSSTEQDFIPTTATPQATAGATTGDGESTTTEVGAVFDGTTTPVDVYLNVLVDDADHDVTSTPCNIIANGTIQFSYKLIGDN